MKRKKLKGTDAVTVVPVPVPVQARNRYSTKYRLCTVDSGQDYATSTSVALQTP